MKPSRLISLAIMIATVASPALAWPGGGMGPSWGGGPYGQGPYGRGWNGGDAALRQESARVTPQIVTLPLKLENGWNQVALNLNELTQKAYGTMHAEI